jgi:glyoxylase-like metal-dependent hydrolase (beta-lactamase superfamily II)/8-oxo-dGTP pyrophosphatase MutT (NUDIX family)
VTGEAVAPSLRIRPAATIALIRAGTSGIEVLMTHRPATMDFGPGLHVFPGGAVDAGDADPRLLSRSARSPQACADAWVGELAPEAAAAHHVAAIRELYEEAGVLLATRPDGTPPAAGDVAPALASGRSFVDVVESADLVLRTDRLVPLSRWVTPPRDVTRRYDARFFVAALPDGASVVLDEREVAAHEWLMPRAALAARAAGRIELWPPTSTTLQQLAAARALADVAAYLAPRTPVRPVVVETLGPALARVRLTGAGAIAGQAVNAYVAGRRRMVVVDPGDPSDEAAEAVLALAAARGGEIVGVLLTSPAPDHAAGATAITNRVDVPVLAGPGAADVLWGPVRTVGEGETIDLADVPIVAHLTPGSDPCHVAYELPEARAVLVGDLFGPGPSRSIPEPPDAAALERSMAQIAGLGPLERLPAHDDGAG